jgi:hypothetical protein
VNEHEIPIDVRRAIIEQELQMYRNTRYQMQLRHRVQRGVGASPEMLKPIEDELERIEGALDLLARELEECK